MENDKKIIFSATQPSGKITLGELPTASKALLGGLALTCVCMGIYVGCEALKKKKLSKNH